MLDLICLFRTCWICLRFFPKNVRLLWDIFFNVGFVWDFLFKNARKAFLSSIRRKEIAFWFEDIWQLYIRIVELMVVWSALAPKDVAALEKIVFDLFASTRWSSWYMGRRTLRGTSTTRSLSRWCSPNRGLWRRRRRREGGEQPLPGLRPFSSLSFKFLIFLCKLTLYLNLLSRILFWQTFYTIMPCTAFYRTQVNLGSDLWVRMSQTHKQTDVL